MTTPYVPVNQPRTILGPLTTIFTPPMSCGNVCFVNGHEMTGWRGQSCLATFVNGMVDATQCWPPTTAGASYPSRPFEGWGFYSPGLVCPHGYTSACTATANALAQWPVQFEMLEGETAVGCCPSGYTCRNYNTNGAGCRLTATSTVMTMATCDSAESMIPFLVTYPLVTALTASAETTSQIGDDISPLSTTTIETIRAWAPMIQINWRSTDLAATPTSEPSSTTSASSESTTVANEKPSGTVNVGSIVGITVGCVVALLVACAVWFLIRRRRRTKLQAGAKGQREHHLKISQTLAQDHGNSAPAELEHPRKPLEVAGTRCVAELDATSSQGGL